MTASPAQPASRPGGEHRLPGAAGARDLVVVSNRGPLSFALDGDDLVTRKAAGGLVSALLPAVTGTGTTWVAGAITDSDRAAAEQGLVEGEGLQVRLLAIDEHDYRAYYDVVANSTLWYLYHGLFDRPRRPHLDRHWRAAWARYRHVNARFAELVIETAPRGAVVLVQDYHLSLLAPHITRERPDLSTVHFHHTPFCQPHEIRVLPDDVAGELLGSLAAADACGFHTARWAGAFTACCQAVLGQAPQTFTAPAAPDLDDVEGVAASEACDREVAGIEGRVGDRKLIVRVDRIELSKNLLRGFHAFDELLETRPQWREKVVFGAFVYPSRATLPDYLGYRAEVETLVERINARWGTPGWTPVLLDAADNFTTSVAALRRYDVLVVNPVRDGLNLVAKEGAAVNQRDGVVVLSRESGVWDELGTWALGVNPFDISATAQALHDALSMEPAERSARSAGMAAAARRRGPLEWLTQQAEAAAG